MSAQRSFLPTPLEPPPLALDRQGDRALELPAFALDLLERLLGVVFAVEVDRPGVGMSLGELCDDRLKGQRVDAGVEVVQIG